MKRAAGQFKEPEPHGSESSHIRDSTQIGELNLYQDRDDKDKWILEGHNKHGKSTKTNITRMSHLGMTTPKMEGSSPDRVVGWSVRPRLKNASAQSGNTREIAERMFKWVDEGKIVLVADGPARNVKVPGQSGLVYYQEFYPCSNALFGGKKKSSHMKIIADMPLVVPLKYLLRRGLIPAEGSTCSFKEPVKPGPPKRGTAEELGKAKETYRKQELEFALVSSGK